ncbi:MAG: serine/threonine protein kinase [Hyphomicrobium sp.]|nr:serine/threonine protein kinase [Hyphomicrobium sp.]
MTTFNALGSATELAGDFRIDRVLGAGGFGVTYLAHEIGLARLVTIKEYFPADFAARVDGVEAAPRSQGSGKDYQWGLDRFIEEAQTLAKFDHPNIVRVYRTFKANNTAYMVLQWEEGQSLKAWLKSLGRAPRQKELDRIIAPLLDALETIHKADFLHRDIAPDNIIIRKSGEPVLIDFGAARGDIAAHSKTKTVSALVKPGYSPYEQYAETSRQQGPWTDIYALAATLYHAITGKRPPDSPSRMLTDEFVPSAQAALSSYRSTFLEAIDRGLALAVDARPQTVAVWRGALLAPEPKKPGFLSRMREGAEEPKKTRRQAATASSEKDATSVIPPPPDAPGPAGRLLDFVEGLRSPSEKSGPKAPVKAPAKAAPAVQAEAVLAASAPRPSGVAAGAQTRAMAAALVPEANATPKLFPKGLHWFGLKKKSASANGAQAAAPANAEPVRARKKPRPAPDVARRRRWTRGLPTKLTMAACMVSGILVFRNDLPRLLSNPQASAITTGAISHSDIGLNVAGSFKAHDGAIERLALSGDGRLIVTAGSDRVLKLWFRETHAQAGAIYLDDGPATSLDVRNNRALTTHADGSVNIWDLDKQRRLYRFKRNDASVWSGLFIGSEDHFAAAGHDWVVALWETSSETAPVRVLEGHSNAVQALAADRSGTWLASGGADKTVKLWNLETGEVKATYRNHSDYVSALAVTDDGAMVASGTLDGVVRLWTRSTRRPLRTFSAHRTRITALTFSPDGQLLASAAEDGSVRVRGLKSARPYWTFGSLEHGAKALAFDGEGRQLLTGGQDGVVTLWSLPVPALAQR